jgi:hypothetical protein
MTNTSSMARSMGGQRDTQSLGSAVRAPQSGRIRMYVTVLLGAIVLGIAAVIVVVVSR